MHKSHNAPFCDRNVHMCALSVLLQNDALWDIYLMHCGICEMGLLRCVSAGTELPCHLGHAYIISENAKRLTSIQVSTTAIWRPTVRERITVPTNRKNSVRNQFQPRKGVI